MLRTGNEGIRDPDEQVYYHGASSITEWDILNLTPKSRVHQPFIRMCIHFFTF